MQPPKLTYVAGLWMLLLSLALTATAQQDKPWERKPCKEHPGWCGIIVTFNPPLDAAAQGGYSSSARGDTGPLLVPNEVTVDVPLELHPTKVVVSSYPRGTGVADIPSEVLVVMYRAEKLGNFARFRGQIKKCTDQGSVQVLVYCKGFERYPVDAGVGGAIECEQSCTTDAQCPSGQRCGFTLGCESKGKCIVPSGKNWCIDPGGRCGCDGRPVSVFCGAGSATDEYTSAPANAGETCPRPCTPESGCGNTGLVCQNSFCVKR